MPIRATPPPVSYTHLDVYKRQAGDTPAVKHFIGSRPILFHGIQKVEYIFLVPDPFRLGRQLMDQPVQ